MINLYDRDPAKTAAYHSALLARGYKSVPTRQREGALPKYEYKMVKTITRNNGIPADRGGWEWQEEHVFWLDAEGGIRVGRTIKKSMGVTEEVMHDLLAEGGYPGARGYGLS